MNTLRPELYCANGGPCLMGCSVNARECEGMSNESYVALKRELAAAQNRYIADEGILDSISRAVCLPGERHIEVKEIGARFCAMRTELAAAQKDRIPIAELLTEIEHISENGALLREKFGEEHEGRCRELCAMYLREFVLSHELGLRVAAIDAAKEAGKP